MAYCSLRLWHQSTEWHYPRVVWRIGSFFLISYVLLLVVWPDVGGPAETIMALLGLGALFAWGRGLRANAALWILGAAIVVQVISWTLGYFHHPEWSADNPQIDRLAKLFIFIAIAWWLGGSTHNTLLLWSLALAAFFVATFVQGDGLAEWQKALQGQRAEFGIRNAQHTALYFGTGLLGLLAFSRRCFSAQRGRAVLRTLWVLATIICLAGVIVTQTRAAWLALAIALPVMAAIWLWITLRKQGVRQARRGLMIVAGVLFIFGVIIGSTALDAITRTLGKESSVVNMVLEGNFSEVPYSSIGIRIQSWRAAMHWIEERPIVGWGENGRSIAIDQTAWLPDELKQHLGHLHNYFLEVWVSYGVLGLVVMGSLTVWVGRATWLSWRGGIMPGDMALFGTAFFVFWVIMNQFESHASFWPGVYVHNLILGGLVTHYWRWQLTGRKKPLSVEGSSANIRVKEEGRCNL